jgi:fatty acid desaturase
VSHGPREHDARVPPKAAHALPSAVEWPTWALVLAIYGTWATFTMEWTRLPGWLVPLAGGWLVAWHGSLQHETIHGHPSRSRRLNALLGSVPLGLWLPYGVYREMHLRHHAAPLLADPVDDPESPYVTREAWARAGRLRKASLRLQTTLAGRMLVGPFSVVASEWAEAVRRFSRGDRGHLRHWSWHALGVGGVLCWLRLFHVPIGAYLLGAVYPGIALTLLRSFVEHRIAAEPGHRTAIVEAEAPFALLFLNNNLHVVHHDHPGAPWYLLPRLYRRGRETIRRRSGGACFRGYRSVVLTYALRPARACTAGARRNSGDSIVGQACGPDVVLQERLDSR